MKPRRIACILESRATYGYARNVLLAAQHHPELEMSCVVSGMHLIPEFGDTLKTIEADGFNIAAQVSVQHDDDSAASWSIGLGRGIEGFARAFQDIQPDIVLLFGDRIETFGACIAASYMGLATGHIQAGDKSGHIDDMARMAMAKLVHLHFASCENSADRLRRLGEQENRIMNVGAPQLDDIVGNEFTANELLVGDVCYDLEQPYLVLLQHSTMIDRDLAAAQIDMSLRGLKALGMPIFWIFPNADIGFSPIVEAALAESDANVHVIASLPRDAFLRLLGNASALVGNSSCGILEAPTLKVPVVNIGDRQRGRPQASNILNCDWDAAKIAESIRYAVSSEFADNATDAVNPYGDGKSGPRIVEVLGNVKLDRALYDKQTTY